MSPSSAPINRRRDEILASLAMPTLGNSTVNMSATIPTILNFDETGERLCFFIIINNL